MKLSFLICKKGTVSTINKITFPKSCLMWILLPCHVVESRKRPCCWFGLKFRRSSEQELLQSERVGGSNWESRKRGEAAMEALLDDGVERLKQPQQRAEETLEWLA